MFLTNRHNDAMVGAKTVLIAEDDVDIAQVLAARFQQIGFSVMKTPDALHALVGIKKVRPDLIILDINMPGGNGLAACEMLASDQDCRSIPVIIHTACSDDVTVTRCRQLGVHYVLKSSGAWSQIKKIIQIELDFDADQVTQVVPENKKTAGRSQHKLSPYPSVDRTTAPAVITQTPTTEVAGKEIIDSDHLVEVDHKDPAQNTNKKKKPVVLCIDDDADVSKVIQIKLERYGIDVLRASNGELGCATAQAENPDVIVSDLVLPEGEGTYILRRLKSDPSTEDIPVIVLSGQGYPAVQQQLFKQGAAAFLTKPLCFDLLLRELRLYIDFPKMPTVSKFEPNALESGELPNTTQLTPSAQGVES